MNSSMNFMNSWWAMGLLCALLGILVIVLLIMGILFLVVTTRNSGRQEGDDQTYRGKHPGGDHWRQ